MATQPGDAAATRQRIVDAALDTLKQEGITGASARAIARAGGFNQSLIFYHFGSVNELLLAASTHASELRVTRYRERLEGIASLPDLVALARDLHEEDMAEGNITVLTQMLAGAAGEPVIAARLRESFDPWIRVVEDALRQVVDGTGFDAALPVADLAHAITAMFLGIELITHLDVDHSHDETLFDTLAKLGQMVDGLLALGGAGLFGPAEG